MQIFAKFGYSIGRESRTQANASSNVVSEDELKKGDLIFYDNEGVINHVGIYMGEGKIIHSSNPRTGISTTKYNYRSPVKILRILD